MLSAWEADCTGLLLSVTFTVKLTVPFGPVGVPLIAPVLELRLKPAGRLPTLREYVSGAKPPVATTVWLYAVPYTSEGRDTVVIAGAGGRFTAMLSGCDADCTGLLESKTLTVKLAVPFGPVGVPVMAPVLGFRLNPAGNAPVLME